MTKIPMSLFAALVAVVLVCSQPASLGQSADRSGLNPEMRMYTIGQVDVTPDAKAPGLFQGIVGTGPNPPDPGDWPCYGGGPNCSSVAVGGLVIAQPQPVVSHLCDGCAEIFYTFQTTTSSGTADIAITVVQDKVAIFSNGYSFPSIPSQSIQVITTGVVFNSSAKTGPATIEVTTTIGKTKVTGKAAIYLD
jgi:hypothetical protein